ncbi:MAG: tRNA lysidine(34) synthetase TilS [Spongiibacteraceae bacterium]|jgi:tRNA(Ile)-lysidine synthase|nr:tRNA lysidine(34) synthetase TilS [Spongiibacteraceae bacterium]
MDSSALAIRLHSHRDCRRWWVAYSGGLDSHVLLHLCHQLRQHGGPWPELRAIHVNHQLQPQASDWAAHCQAVCGALGIPLTVVPVEVDLTAGLGLEAAARAARYAAFRQLCGSGDLLLQGHHADDQAETVLLRLLSGRGAAAAIGIPAERPLGGATILRPLLQTTRSELEAHAQQHGLHWVEDPSNCDSQYDRNFLRNQVLPLIGQRWPGYRDTLGRAAAQGEQVATVLAEVAALDLAAAAEGERLAIAAALALSQPRRFNLWRHWLAGLQLPQPGVAVLEQLERLATATDDALPLVTWRGSAGAAEVRRYRGWLYAMTPLPPFLPWPAQAWEPTRPLTLPAGGELRAEPVTGEGLRRGLPLSVRSRAGGERCRPAGRRHSQTLRRLLQECELEPWWRERLPLIYSGDELVAVADLWVCEGYQAAPGEPGWALHWHRLTPSSH